MISLFLVFCVLFIYLYEVNFVFIPFLASKQIMELLGMMLFFFDKRALQHLNRYFGIFFAAFLLIVISFISIQMNGGGQWVYHTVFISCVLNFFGAFFIYKLLRKIIKDFDSFLNILIKCVLFQCVIAVLFKVYPPLYNFAYQIVWSEGVEKNVTYGVESLYRLVGLGRAVAFSILPTASLGMLSCAYFIIRSEEKKYYYYCFSLLFISSVSFLIARTSLLLMLLSILYIIIAFIRKHQTSKLVKILVLLGAFVMVILSTVMMILPEDMYEWAFEIFLNMQDGGTGTETGSANLIYTMVTETHFSPITLFIGDAMYMNPNGGYYGSVDIGFFRQVLYYGLPGLLTFLFLHYMIIKKCVRKSNDSDKKSFFLFLFLGFLVILAKGDTTLAPLFIFLLVMMDFGGLCSARTIK